MAYLKRTGGSSLWILSLQVRVSNLNLLRVSSLTMW